MSLLNALRTGASGLRVASAGLSTVAHNVTNATTEGYSRRTLSSTVADPVTRYGLSYGEGSVATGFLRAGDRFVDASLIEARGEAARHEATLERLSIIETEFDEASGNDLATAYEAFFDELTGLAYDPADDTMRLAAITAGRTLAQTINRTDATIASTMSDVVEQLGSSTSDIQADLDAVAMLNEQIASSGGMLSSGDYADKVFQLATSLADSIGATVEFASDGQATVMLGGHAVVSGATARTVAIDTDDEGRPHVTVSADGGTIDVTSLVGGTMGGLVDTYDTASDLRSTLDDFAQTLATEFNSLHAAGFDANGDAGGTFFNFTSGSAAATIAVDEALVADVSLFALAGDASAEPGDGDNLKALIDLQNSQIYGPSSQTGGQYLASMYSTVGTVLARSEAEYETYDMLTTDLGALRESISGVDLDEEATNLMAWEAAYEAAARVVSTANDLLGELMEVVR